MSDNSLERPINYHADRNILDRITVTLSLKVMDKTVNKNVAVVILVFFFIKEDEL